MSSFRAMLSFGPARVATALVSVVAALSFCAFRWMAASSAPELPVDQLLVPGRLADESACIECHSQAEEFWLTGHANTLAPARSDDSVQLLSTLAKTMAPGTEGTAIAVRDGEPFATFSSDAGDGELPLDWCFGSGHHARTWISTLADSQGATDLLEFRWTWYASIDGFDITPGQPDQHFGTYLGPCGVFYDHPKARRCFACHSTHLPIDDGRLRFEELRPNVTCQRCHGPRADHVASEGEIRDDFWQTATAEEAVNRCAQCHRRADEVEVEEIRADNTFLARFQPIGLVQSACFKSSGTLTCTTCHDPHRPLEVQDSLGDWQCLQCHDPDQSDDSARGQGSALAEHVLCAAGEKADCLTCHMPKVQGDDPLPFTDHWIRVR